MPAPTKVTLEPLASSTGDSGWQTPNPSRELFKPQGHSDVAHVNTSVWWSTYQYVCSWIYSMLHIKALRVHDESLHISQVCQFVHTRLYAYLRIH